MNIDERFMYRAIQLAKNGKGNTSPNPMVGAVIVHDGMIIGEGYHRRCGEGLKDRRTLVCAGGILSQQRVLRCPQLLRCEPQ